MTGSPLPGGLILPDGREILRETYVLKQLDTIYAIAYTQVWLIDEMNQLLETELPIVNLNKIWVVRKYQHRGYGHTLLRRICTDADRFGCVMTLEVQPDNRKDYKWIHSMYEHAGFRDDPTIGGMTRWPIGQGLLLQSTQDA